MKERSATTDLLREAAEWRLISLLLECTKGDWKTEVSTLSKEVKDLELNNAAKCAQTQASEGLYHSIFGPGGPAPAREVSYRDWVQPGYLLSELTAFYDAFSYRPNLKETPDHIAVETGFVSFLKLKEAFAEERKDTENAAITAEAVRDFITAHLTKTTEKMAAILAHSQIEYLALAASALFKRVGKDPDQNIKRILPTLREADSEIFECGGF